MVGKLGVYPYLFVAVEIAIGCGRDGIGDMEGYACLQGGVEIVTRPEREKDGFAVGQGLVETLGTFVLSHVISRNARKKELCRGG